MNRVMTIEHSLKGSKDRDLVSLDEKITDAVVMHNQAGYRVISVTSLTRSYQSTDGDYPYAESFTCGVVLVFEKISE
jgi:hypothetical protein